MSISRWLQDDVNRLVRPTDKRSSALAPVTDVESFVETTGSVKGGSALSAGGQVGAPPKQNQTPYTLEVLNVYSSLIITEQGAYEKPPNWPTDGIYPGSTFVLDTALPYYEQRRVHLVLKAIATVDKSGNTQFELQEDRFMVDLAQPYSGILQGLESASSGIGGVAFKGFYAVGKAAPMTAKILARVRELQDAGVAI